MVQIGSPQCVQLEKLRRHSCRTEALLKTEQEAAWNFRQSCGKWWTGAWPTQYSRPSRLPPNNPNHTSRVTTLL